MCVCVCVCVSVCLCVCVSVKSHLTSGTSVRPEYTVIYSATEVKNCGFFSEIAPLQRSSTAPLKVVRMVGHFPAESAHSQYHEKNYSQYHVKRSFKCHWQGLWHECMVVHFCAFIVNVRAGVCGWDGVSEQ